MATVAERIGKGRFVSIELWPPRSPASVEALEAALEELTGLGPAEDYFALVDAPRARGADAPVIPDVMPIVNVRQVERMAAMSGRSVPLALAERLHAVADHPDEVRRIGVEHATQLSRDLLDGGAPGLHFYTMNRAAATLEVCANLGWEAAPVGGG